MDSPPASRRSGSPHEQASVALVAPTPIHPIVPIPSRTQQAWVRGQSHQSLQRPEARGRMSRSTPLHRHGSPAAAQLQGDGIAHAYLGPACEDVRRGSSAVCSGKHTATRDGASSSRKDGWACRFQTRRFQRIHEHWQVSCGGASERG